MITFTCTCGKVLKVADEFAGKPGQCPACGEQVTVPVKLALAETAGSPEQDAGSKLATSIVKATTAAKKVPGLGIAGLCVGVAAVIICWVPVLGLLVGLVAPIVFDGFYEVRVGLGVSMVLLTCAAALEPRSRAHSRSRMLKISAPAACTAIVVLLWPSSATENQILHQVRGFFGVLRVSDTRGSETPQRHLSSGSTLHGIEFLVPGGGRMPSAYFGTVSGIGLALGQRETAGPMHVGIVGLGAGTLSAYGEEGDRFRFYEIDPEVVSIARDMGLFSFVSSSYAEVSIVLGDARLMIADEQSRGGSQAYDVLVVDAFSSDAIPVHLLTLEAFRHYTDAIVDDGVLAIHVSNRHLDLAPVVARIGFEVGLKTLYVHTRSSPPNQSRRAQWVMMSRSAERLGKLARKMRSTIEAKGLPPQHLEIYVLTRPDVSHIPLWTDDYSDLFGALKP